MRSRFPNSCLNLSQPSLWMRLTRLVPAFLAACMVVSAAHASSSDTVASSKPIVSNTPQPPAKPAAAHRRWYQIGIASWYGAESSGRPTANGEIFTGQQFTCAHRDLPLGTWLRVTNLHNHKSVFVRVNDRGPLLDDRIVDLSQRAAQAIDIKGMGYVRLDLTTPDEITRAASATISELKPPSLLPRTR